MPMRIRGRVFFELDVIITCIGRNAQNRNARRTVCGKFATWAHRNAPYSSQMHQHRPNTVETIQSSAYWSPFSACFCLLPIVLA